MRKKSFWVLSVLLLIVAALCGAFFYAARLYYDTGLSPVAEWDARYDNNGKLLLSEDRDFALLVRTVGKVEFEKIELCQVDLSPFGFEGEVYSYYPVTFEEDYGVANTYLFTPDSAYEGFWPVSRKDRFVYLAENGEKYCIHPREGLCYPMFSDSVEGVDVYGKDVRAFSANGSYAIALDGDRVTVYHTDPMDDSLRVVDQKSVSLSSYGSSFTFGAFVGNTRAYFRAEGEEEVLYIALDCETGAVARSLLDPAGEYGNVIDRLFVQRTDASEKDPLRAKWSHVLLGEERKSKKLSGFRESTLISVSPQGTYAVGQALGEKGGEVLVMSEKRTFSLSSVLKEGEQVEEVSFVYENLIFVTLRKGDGQTVSRCYKICF